MTTDEERQSRQARRIANLAVDVQRAMERFALTSDQEDMDNALAMKARLNQLVEEYALAWR